MTWGAAPSRFVSLRPAGAGPSVLGGNRAFMVRVKQNKQLSAQVVDV
jgi:hypothetical protein